jgi:hypothetical protein
VKTEARIKCYQCRRSTSMEVLGPVSGEETQLTMTVHGLPVHVCENGHRQFTHTKGALQRLLRLADEGGAPLPISREQGRLFKRRVCSDCGEGVERDSRRWQTFHIEMQLTELPPFGIDLTVPVYRCRGCGKGHVRSSKDIREHAPAALVRALRAAGIGAE